MKTEVYFIVTCAISTGALFAATGMKNPFPAFVVAFGIWILFLWGWNRRMKRKAIRRSMEQQFENFMRSKYGSRS